MISLPNPTNKMELTQDQYDKLLALYIEQIVDGMDMDSLVQVVSEMLEEKLRESCSMPEELLDEIQAVYDREFAEDLLESVMNVDS